MAKKTDEISWLDDLEAKVREAADEIKRLKKRVVELEKELAGSVPHASSNAWADQRDEVRRRVESLVDHLSALLKEDS